MTEHINPRLSFIATKAHARFEELAAACVQYRYIGICHGRPGVGKTRSAMEYASWQSMHDLTVGSGMSDEEVERIKACSAVFYTATVSNTPNTLNSGLSRHISNLGAAKLAVEKAELQEIALRGSEACPLVIVDEADRLSLKSFEHLRDMYDRNGFGLILLGMPGLEKRLARYPQLYSRVGFVHEFKPLSKDEMRFLFERQSEAFGIVFNPDIFPEAEAMAAIIRITRGNFRLIERLFAQMKRIMDLNQAESLSTDIVQAARECLVIGPAE